MDSLRQMKDQSEAPLTEEVEVAQQVQSASVLMRAAIAALTTQQVKALLVEAGFAYHQRDGNHRVIKRGLKVRYQSRQKAAVLVGYALSFTDLQERGDEQLFVEIRQALSRAKEVLEHAGLEAAFLGVTGMTLITTPVHSRDGKATPAKDGDETDWLEPGRCCS